MIFSGMAGSPCRAQGEGKGRALLDSAFGPDRTSMAVNDTLHGGQADACAREIPLTVQALKSPEQFRAVGHVEAGAVVANEIDHPAVTLPNPEFYVCPEVLACELPGIAQQIFQHDPQQLAIALDDPCLGNDKIRLALRLELAQLVCHGLRQGAEI